MKYEKELIQLGLSTKEARVYLAALRAGPATVHEMQTATKLKRSTTYNILMSLKERGLMTVINKNTKKYFIAEDIDILRKKLTTQFNTIETILPGLRAMTVHTPSTNQMKHLEGDLAIKQALHDISEHKNTTLYAWSNYDLTTSHYGEQFVQGFINSRVKNRTQVFEISNESPTSNSFRKHDQKHLRTMRHAISAHNAFSTEIYLYAKKKVAILNPKKESMTHIEDTDTFNMMKHLFDVHWTIAQ
jgi:hypothetical protein